MSPTGGRRLQGAVALAALAAASIWAFASVPLQPGAVGQLEGSFMLSAGLGSAAGAGYLLVRYRTPFASGARPRFSRALGMSLLPAAVFAYLATGLPELLAPLPIAAGAFLFAARGAGLHGPSRPDAANRTASEDSVVGLVSGRPRLRRLAERRVPRFAALLARAGEVGNPYALSARGLMLAIVAVPPSLAAAIVLGVLLSPPFAVLAALPLVPYFSAELRLRDRISQRREGVERELPFFSILVNVLGGAGESLYAILAGLTKSEVFGRIRDEALLVRRDVEVFGSDPNEALETLAASHPSRKFCSFLNGYTSKVRSGGDIPAFLSGESGALLRELEEGWTRYAARAGTIGSSMITVFGVVPLLLLVVGIFSPSISVFGLTVFTGLCVPVFTVLLVYAAGRMQPAGDQPLEGNLARSLVLSLPGLAVALVAPQVWLTAASTLFIFLVVYGISVREQRVEMREIDEAVPEFLKDVLEYKRQEYDLARSVASIAARRRYTPAFDRVLALAAVQLRAGIPMDELEVDPKTRLARTAFFVLGQMGRSGGGSVETVYQLSAYTSKVVEMKRSTRAEMRPYMLLAYASPVLLAFGVSFVQAVLQSFSSAVKPSLSGARSTGLQVGTTPPALLDVSSLLIVVSAAALGVIGAKMTDFTVRNTLKASANVVVAVSATYLLSLVGLSSLFRL